MKQIIDGKTYNTETATFIDSDSYSNPSDFHHWDESLYVTKKGNYFIDGGGGPLTKYAVSTGNNSTSGSCKIIPLTDKEALEWMEEHSNAEKIEKHFHDMIEEA